jgi:hypothetical protein
MLLRLVKNMICFRLGWSSPIYTKCTSETRISTWGHKQLLCPNGCDRRSGCCGPTNAWGICSWLPEHYCPKVPLLLSHWFVDYLQCFSSSVGYSIILDEKVVMNGEYIECEKGWWWHIWCHWALMCTVSENIRCSSWYWVWFFPHYFLSW